MAEEKAMAGIKSAPYLPLKLPHSVSGTTPGTLCDSPFFSVDDPAGVRVIWHQVRSWSNMC
jgi:hypothetical protein